MSEVPRIYLDANVFITAFENVGARSDHAWWLLNAIEEREVEAVTSEITLAEILVKPLELGDQKLAESYQSIVAPNPLFEVSPVTRDRLVEAATVRARRPSIKLPDAIHIATAQHYGCNFFVSNDERLAMPAGMRRIPLGPFTLDDLRTNSRD
ncbi:type II toxin-antitoxin system VapC family toxin [Ancylobacter terrae]|uniref:type II toxin-antitoxin system VapC family toxin n=1 Tax=Ancylobacter sp. sgz301288 TaxID=3342077 RepID=UPI003859C31C